MGEKKNWCPINQCECLFENCYACEIMFGSEWDIEDSTRKPEIMCFPNEKPTHKVWLCRHYNRELKRRKLK